jgi:hypothetical protein
MTTRHIRLMVPPPVAVPRGAILLEQGLNAAAATARALRGAWRSVQRTLRQAGARRAARELTALAQRHEAFDAAVARALRESARDALRESSR